MTALNGWPPTILKLFELDKASDALGVRLQISTMLCGLITHDVNDGTIPFGEGQPADAAGIFKAG